MEAFSILMENVPLVAIVILVDLLKTIESQDMIYMKLM